MLAVPMALPDLKRAVQLAIGKEETAFVKPVSRTGNWQNASRHLMIGPMGRARHRGKILRCFYLVDGSLTATAIERSCEVYFLPF